MATKTEHMDLRGFFGHWGIANENLKRAKKHIQRTEAFACAVRQLFPDDTVEEILRHLRAHKESLEAN